ncbi:hypothetical protein [Rhodococcus sp. IEGM 1379]|uniref:Rv1733c family protein n=1 Tax=Rhodococcus sp. IEGM 1379 TaxID=3047086 RepID=UPI0024B6F76E|nr:hypothetical protein [Rhodococcus sp. IEGM 1379]MDI9914464.1 hypothetical protein [Rhodococcus sp. IEGM 1379]
MRTSDRLLSALIIAAIAVVALAIPVSATIGTSVYSSDRARIEQEHSTYQEWNGTVVSTPPEPPAIPDITATKDVGAAQNAVTWTMNGAPRTEPLIAHYGVKIGDTITVWTNDKGGQVRPPTETSTAAVDGVAAAVVLCGAIAVTMYLMVAVARNLIGRHNARMWDAEWKNKFQQHS